MKTPIDHKRIAIIGGGPGGLTLARLLQKNGADVTVYERDASREVRVQGATLDLHYDSGLAALDAAGLMDAFKANYRPGADKLRLTDKSAHIHFEDGFAGTAYDLQRPEIDRGPLRDILLDSLAPGTVVWDSQFLSLSREEDLTTLEFKNGQTASADIVIAADGGNSRIRPYITSVKPFYSGVTALEATVYDSATACPGIHELLDGGKIFALDESKTLIVSSKGDGSLLFYLSCKLPESWVNDCGIDFTDRMQVFTWFKKEFVGWAESWDELFLNAAVPFIPRPFYCMPPDQTWETLPNITMLGDAAHLMPPFAGEGVNMAMLDALELANCLLNPDFANAQMAIAAYEEQMRARAAEVIDLTQQQTESMHSPAGLLNLLQLFTQLPRIKGVANQ